MMSMFTESGPLPACLPAFLKEFSWRTLVGNVTHIKSTLSWNVPQCFGDTYAASSSPKFYWDWQPVTSVRPDSRLTDLSPADSIGDDLMGSQQKRLPHRCTVNTQVSDSHSIQFGKKKRRMVCNQLQGKCEAEGSAGGDGTPLFFLLRTGACGNTHFVQLRADPWTC